MVAPPSLPSSAATLSEAIVLADRLAHLPAASQPARKGDQITRAEFHRLAVGRGHLDLAFQDIAGLGRVVLPVEDAHLLRPDRAAFHLVDRLGRRLLYYDTHAVSPTSPAQVADKSTGPQLFSQFGI